ncbi:MAG: DNA alkylation repair protein [Candidatus Paceibacterota bacterium]|jgi:3-methyladenine DNA glycosylase AlkD
MDSVSLLRFDINKLKSSYRAKVSQSFFKTGKGQYGEGDIFIGLTVPQCRMLSKKYLDLSKSEVGKILKSKIHEERLIALLILVEKFSKGDNKKRKEIFDFYLKNIKYINNWDLVDLSADKIVGAYLLDKDKNILLKLVLSKNIWERRISVISTFNFIKNGKFDWTLKISKILLNDSHDLIQKAVGWMLREVGKKSIAVEKTFLNKYYRKMPRTMLRYAIERFSEKERQKYLKGVV